MHARSFEPRTRRFIEARCSWKRTDAASTSRTTVPRETSRAGVRQRTCSCSDVDGGTRHTVVASGFACQAEVSRETSIRTTSRPHLMRVAPRTHCERESACVPPGSVSIQLHAQVKGRIGSFHVNLLVYDASAPPTKVSAGKESLMPEPVLFTGNVGGPKVVWSSKTGFPPLRVCRVKSME